MAARGRRGCTTSQRSRQYRLSVGRIASRRRARYRQLPHAGHDLSRRLGSTLGKLVVRVGCGSYVRPRTRSPLSAGIRVRTRRTPLRGSARAHASRRRVRHCLAAKPLLIARAHEQRFSRVRGCDDCDATRLQCARTRLRARRFSLRRRRDFRAIPKTGVADRADAKATCSAGLTGRPYVGTSATTRADRRESDVGDGIPGICFPARPCYSPTTMLTLSSKR